MNNTNLTFQNIRSHKSGNIHRILCRRIGWCIRMLQSCQVIDCPLTLNHLRHHLDALVHAVEAHDLRAQQATCFRSEKNLYRHRNRSRIIARMRSRMRIRRNIRHVHSFEQLGICADSSNSQIEHLRNGSTHRSGIHLLVSQGNIIRHNTSLLVRRSCQRNHCRLIGDQMTHFDCIAERINIRSGSLHKLIHCDASQLPDRQSGFACQLHFRTDTDTQQNQVRLNHFSTL